MWYVHTPTIARLICPHEGTRNCEHKPICGRGICEQQPHGITTKMIRTSTKVCGILKVNQQNDEVGHHYGRLLAATVS